MNANKLIELYTNILQGFEVNDKLTEALSEDIKCRIKELENGNLREQ